MKIYVIEAYADLYHEVFQSNAKWNTGDDFFKRLDILEKLKPKVRFCVKEYGVIREEKDYYVRKNDGSYSEIYTHKKFKKKMEYDYEDEVLNRPYLHSMEHSRIGAVMPTLDSDIEKAKKTIAKAIEMHYQMSISKMNKVIDTYRTSENWEEYEASYDWDDEDEDDDE